MVKKLSLIVFITLLAPSILTVPALATKEYNEAPVLKELVRQGKLPPIEERLPNNPLVLKPLEKIGKYGGTLHDSV
jgi:peptide/nickel transport system substrate-binding protein